MNKGKIFISSTIYDFKDLRSAIKYWLTELGYEVFMSEDSDFPRNATENSYQTCLSTISKCDWFILLIGNRVGGKIVDDTCNQTISITRKEYRTAYDLLKEGKIKKIISFVRKDVWTAKEERKSICRSITDNSILQKIKTAPSKNADIPEEIFSFIDEVRRIPDMLDANKNSEYPKNNWINIFESFSDVVDTLKIELNLNSNISTLIWYANITEEIKHNIKKLMVKNSKDFFCMFAPVTQIRDKCVEQLKSNGRKYVIIAYNDLVAIGGTFITNTVLESRILKESLLEGIFLNYNAEENVYVTDSIYNQVIQLINTIDENNSNEQLWNDAHIFFNNEHEKHKVNRTENIRIEYNKIAPILIEHDKLSNIFNLSIYLLRVINNVRDIESPKLYPTRFYDNFEIVTKENKALFDSYDEFYGTEVSDDDITYLIDYYIKKPGNEGDK